jgi:hypothetical protein
MVLTFPDYEAAVTFYAGMLRDMSLDDMTQSLAAYMLEARNTTTDEKGQFVVFEHAA